MRGMECFILRNMKNVKNIVNEEINKLVESVSENNGIIRLYHRIGNKRGYTIPELIRSVIKDGLVPHDNGEVGAATWFSSNIKDYGDNGQFVVALDFDLSTNGYANNKYELSYDGQTNAYAYKNIQFEDLVVIKIPVIDGRHLISSLEMIEYSTWYTPELMNDPKSGSSGETLYVDIFNKYVQPYINIPNYAGQLDPNRVKLINVMD